MTNVLEASWHTKKGKQKNEDITLKTNVAFSRKRFKAISVVDVSAFDINSSRCIYCQVNFGKSAITGLQSRKDYFDRVSFSGTDLYGSTFFESDFSSVDFTNALLGEVEFERCEFRGCVGLIHLGARSDGYDFYMVRQDDVGYRILAGCRWFSPSEAAAHWSVIVPHGRFSTIRPHAAETQIILAYAKKLAKHRGWAAQKAAIEE